MASDDPIARRRRIAEKGSDRLALITGGRAPNLHSPPSDTSTAQPYQALSSDETGDPPLNPEGNTSNSTVPKPNQKQSSPKSDLQIYLYKIASPGQLRPAILSTQDTRRKCSFFAGIISLLSYTGFPILGSYIIKNTLLLRPLLLLLVINVVITIGPLVMDAMRLIQQESSGGSSSSEGDLGSPFEWGMLFKTGFCALFMDSCIYSVVVVCGTSICQKFGL